MTMLDGSLQTRVIEVAHSRRLLVASDYDGTLSTIVRDRERAIPVEGVREALHILAALPDTHVALISGRGRGDLGRVSGLGAPIELIGSHGVEFEHGFDPPLTTAQQTLQRELKEELMGLCGRFPALTCEVKPGSLAIHYRDAPIEQTAAALDAIDRGPARRAGVQIRQGLEVVELTVVSGTKGDAIRRLQDFHDATATVFIGDDVTDEDGFDALGHTDLSVKVGPGETKARHRVVTPSDVSELLRVIGVAREEAFTRSGRLDLGPVN